MRKEIYVCDVCGKDLHGEERFAIDAKVRKYDAANPKGRQVNFDICEECFGKMCRQFVEEAK